MSNLEKIVVRLSKKEVVKLSNNKAVVYRIKNNSGTNIYTGVAKRGQLVEELQNHFYGGGNYVPGARVQVEEVGSIADAREVQQEIIKREQPKHNKEA